METVDPITLAGLACELREGRHRGGVTCLPLQDRMDTLALVIRVEPLDIGAIVLLHQLGERGLAGDGLKPYTFRCWRCGAPVIQVRYTSQPMCHDGAACIQRAERRHHARS